MAAGRPAPGVGAGSSSSPSSSASPSRGSSSSPKPNDAVAPPRRRGAGRLVSGAGAGSSSAGKPSSSSPAERSSWPNESVRPRADATFSLTSSSAKSRWPKESVRARGVGALGLGRWGEGRSASELRGAGGAAGAEGAGAGRGGTLCRASGVAGAVRPPMRPAGEGGLAARGAGRPAGSGGGGSGIASSPSTDGRSTMRSISPKLRRCGAVFLFRGSATSGRPTFVRISGAGVDAGTGAGGGPPGPSCVDLPPRRGGAIAGNAAPPETTAGRSASCCAGACLAGAPTGAPEVSPAASAGGSAPGLRTSRLVPHFGQRIFSPVGGMRFSSTWYGDPHPSHSTLTMLSDPDTGAAGFPAGAASARPARARW